VYQWSSKKKIFLKTQGRGAGDLEREGFETQVASSPTKTLRRGKIDGCKKETSKERKDNNTGGIIKKIYLKGY